MMAGDETQRLQALHRYGILDSDPETPYDDITALASFICGTPMAAISLIDKNRQWFKSALGMSVRETAREAAFCNHTIRASETLIVENALADARFASNPLVTGDPNIRFYAGTPLIDAKGNALGTLCVIDTKPRQLAVAERAALERLGRQALALLESRRLNEELQSMARLSVARLMRTRALQTISSALIEQRDIGELQQIVVDLIAEALPADRVTIYTVDTARQLIIECRKGGRGAREVVDVSFSELWDGLTGWVLRNGRPALSPNTSPDAREHLDVQKRRRATQCGDIIVVPITYKDNILGTITAINALDGASFGTDHVDLMVAMANQVAIAVRTSSLFSALKHNAAALKSATDRMLLATDAARMGIWEWDLKLDTLQWDDQMFRIYGRERTGSTEPFSFWEDTVHPEDLPRTMAAINEARARSGYFDEEFRILWLNGETRHLKATAQVERSPLGQAIRMVGVSFDITKRKNTELQLKHDARRDKLTNLANRAVFMERLTGTISRVESGQQTHFAVLFLDFDRFKLINDTLGHDAGDELLREIADRLRRSLRASDTVCNEDIGNVVSRFGGDEFLILINDVNALNDIQVVANRLLAGLAPAYHIHGTDWHSSASIGIVTSQTCFGTAEDFVRCADLAMYEAKRAGRACWVAFTEGMRASPAEPTQRVLRTAT